MPYQYDRKYRLTITDRENGLLFTITDLRLTFDIQNNVDNKSKTNTAEVKVYNLGEELLSKLSGKEYGCYCRLDVGYGANLQTILIADILQISTQKEGVDRVTSLKMSDAYTSLNNIKISKTYPEDISVGEILKDVLDSAAISYSPFLGNSVNNKCTYGYPAHGTPKQILDDLCKSNNIEWMMVRDVLFIKDKYQLLVPSAKQEYALVINKDSGLIDIPYTHTEEVSQAIDQSINDNEVDVSDTSLKKDGTPRKRKTRRIRRFNIQAKALINPSVKPNSLIKIETDSNNLSGFYRVRTVKFNGDTRGNDWHMELFLDNVENL